MRQKTHQCHQSDAVRPAGCGVAAAAYIAIPQLTLKTELFSQGNFKRIIPILHEIGRYTDIAPLLTDDFSPLSVLKKALNQWFTEMLPKEVESALDFELDFITDASNRDGSGWEFGAEDDDYVLLFRLGSPYADDFSIDKAIQRYEAEYPGLGQKILRKIESATPFCLGTPAHFLEIVRDNCWGGYETGEEYIEDMVSGEDEKDREEVRQMYRDEMCATRADFDYNFESWMLSPADNVFQGTIQPELNALFRFPDRKYRLTEYPYSNTFLPGILIWRNEMIFECFDSIYNAALNDGMDIILNGLFWVFKKDRKNLKETVNEIEQAVRSLGKLLLILNKIHVEEENHGNLNSERNAIPA